MRFIQMMVSQGDKDQIKSKLTIQ